MSAEQKSERGLVGKSDIRVNPEQMGPFGMRQKLRKALIARSGNQAFSLQDEYLEFHADTLGFGCEIEKRGEVVSKEFAVMRRCHDDWKKPPELAPVHHNPSPHGHFGGPKQNFQIIVGKPPELRQMPPFPALENHAIDVQIGRAMGQCSCDDLLMDT